MKGSFVFKKRAIAGHLFSLEVELPVITRDRRHKTDFKITELVILYNATCYRRRDNDPEMGSSVFNCRENPLVLSHCNGLMYKRPKGITLDAAESHQLLKLFHNLILHTSERIDSIRAGDRQACMEVTKKTPAEQLTLYSSSHSSDF
ncbi:hypothetical protein PO909_032567 [Leuciscus waleckii]